MATNTATRAAEQLNSLLRGEISAVETYTQAVAKVGDDHASDAETLRAIEREHGRNAQRLREEVRRLGGDADNASGAWGVWAKTVQGAANLFGDGSALKALKEGEEHGLKDFERAMKSGDLDPSSLRLVEELIGDQQRHIATLDRLLARVKATA